jgi:SAM-dependent methyltransferase
MKKYISSYTRGKGLFEPLLARLRTQRANRLIPQDLRAGRILDVGCGSYPYFLAHTAFQEKFAIDQSPLAKEPALKNQIEFYTIDLNRESHLPFSDGFFGIVTLLAVVEHLNPDRLVLILKECYRVLMPDGLVILTTPAAWTDVLLKLMARLNLVSVEEIREHTFAYTLPLIGWHFGQAGFAINKVRFGYFEMGLNMWATATR